MKFPPGTLVDVRTKHEGVVIGRIIRQLKASGGQYYIEVVPSTAAKVEQDKLTAEFGLPPEAATHHITAHESQIRPLSLLEEMALAADDQIAEESDGS